MEVVWNQPVPVLNPFKFCLLRSVMQLLFSENKSRVHPIWCNKLVACQSSVQQFYTISWQLMNLSYETTKIELEMVRTETAVESIHSFQQ